MKYTTLLFWLLTLSSCARLPERDHRVVKAIVGWVYIDSERGIVGTFNGSRRPEVELSLTEAEFDTIFYLADSLGFWKLDPFSERSPSAIGDPSPGRQFIELRSESRSQHIEWKDSAYDLQEDSEVLTALQSYIYTAMRRHPEFKRLPIKARF